MGAIKRELRRRRRQAQTQEQVVVQAPTEAEPRDPNRIRMIFADIQDSLVRVGYHLQADYPGLTLDELRFMIDMKGEVALLIRRAGEMSDKVK